MWSSELTREMKRFGEAMRKLDIVNGDGGGAVAVEKTI